MIDLKEVLNLANAYCEFQDKCPSPFHVVDYLKSELINEEAVELLPGENWSLDEGMKYFVCHPDGKSLIAFHVGRKLPTKTGFHLACAHTDSPVLRLRLNPWNQSDHMSQLLTQIHGGIIARTWLDRPLKAAGAVYTLEREGGEVQIDPDSQLPKYSRQLVCSEKSIGAIPDLAIHLDREKNQSGKIDFENMLSVICGLNEELTVTDFWKLLGKEGKVDGFEISLSSAYPTVLAGLDDSLIIGPRHDDLAMVFAIAQGFAEIKNGTSSDKTVVAGYFDAEETGSTTSSGARSTFLTHTLSKICKSHPSWDPSEHIENAFSQSFHISADMAHGFHPAYAQKFDVNHKVLLNKGIVVKENANDRYATNGQSASIFRGFCELAKIPVQNFVNRQDLGCGSTIGPSVSALLNCIGVDIGAPMWSMHSTAETMGTYDLYYSKLLMQTFFN